MRPSHPELSKLSLAFSHGDRCCQGLWSQSGAKKHSSETMKACFYLSLKTHKTSLRSVIPWKNVFCIQSFRRGKYKYASTSWIVLVISYAYMVKRRVKKTSDNREICSPYTSKRNQWNKWNTRESSAKFDSCVLYSQQDFLALVSCLWPTHRDAHFATATCLAGWNSKHLRIWLCKRFSNASLHQLWEWKLSRHCKFKTRIDPSVVLTAYWHPCQGCQGHLEPSTQWQCRAAQHLSRC